METIIFALAFLWGLSGAVAAFAVGKPYLWRLTIWLGPLSFLMFRSHENNAGSSSTVGLNRPHLQDEIYTIVGEEVSRNQFFPGPMARAVAEANGNRDVVQSLYIRYRFEELYRQTLLAEQQRKNEKHSLTCECGHQGKPNIVPRGSFAVATLLLLMLVVPGLIYSLVYSGYKAVCSKCGRTLIEKI